MIRRLLGATAAVALLLSAGTSLAQDISAQRLSDHIRTLADDSFQGRFPGKPGEELTLKYLQAQYEAMGYEPGGPDGSWLQPVDLVRFTPGAQALTASWTGHDGAVHAMDPAKEIVVRPLTGDGAISAVDAPLVFAGYGIVAPERNWDDYGGIDLTGKIVIILRGQPESFGEDPNFYGSTEHKQAEAFRRGALGVLTLVEGEGAETRWRRAVAGAGRPRMTIADSRTVSFNGSLNATTAQAMAAGHGGDLAAFVARAKHGGDFRAMDTGVKLTLNAVENREVIRSHNLLARLPGAERPNEYVIYSAHWDHIGAGQHDHGDSADVINNGAWDNASGTAGVLEVARAFKAAPRPDRTVVFLHVTAEEQGLLGSQWYAEHPVYPLATTAADINIDMLPFTPATTTVALFGIGKSSLEDDLAALAARQNRTIVGDGEPEQGFYYRSDHFNFAMGGVPAIMPWTSVDFVQGGAAVGKPFYLKQMEDFYHKPADEWRADIDYTAAVQNLQLLFQLGEQVANSEEWPQWRPTAEFRALREQTAEQRR